MPNKLFELKLPKIPVVDDPGFPNRGLSFFEPNKPPVFPKIPAYFPCLLLSFENISPGLDFTKSPNIYVAFFLFIDFWLSSFLG